MTPIHARNTALQRTFSGFPSGTIGAALLLLRVAVGGSAVVSAVLSIVAAQSSLRFVVATPAVIAGLALLPGLMVPVASSLLALLGAVVLIFAQPGAVELLTTRMSMFEFVVMAAVLAALGPGAMSIDARLFGRREVAIG